MLMVHSAMAAMTGAGLSGGKTYDEFVAHIMALANWSIGWRDIIGTEVGLFLTTASAPGGFLAGTTWLTQFRGNNSNPSRAIQHGMESEAALLEQAAATRMLLFEVQVTEYVGNNGITRNGYTSLITGSPSAPRIMPRLLFFDPLKGPQQMQPSLGLGPAPYDW